MDDATGIQDGETKEGGQHLPGDRNSSAYVKEYFRQVEVGVPGGFTSRRPQEQREINFLAQRKYDGFLEDIMGVSDFSLRKVTP